MKCVSITPVVVKPQMKKLQNRQWKTGLRKSRRNRVVSESPAGRCALTAAVARLCPRKRTRTSGSKTKAAIARARKLARQP